MGSRIKCCGLVLMVTLTLFEVMGLSVALAAETPKEGGTFVVALSTDVTKLDPHATGAAVDATVLNHVVEPLVVYGKKLELVPLACDRWEANTDYTAFTFYLPKGKRFHNGREMVAEDVKYSLERLVNPETGNPRRQLYEPLDRVEVIDPYTVKAHLKKSFAGFLHVLAFPAPISGIVPREEVEKQGGSITHPVGTGPFKFVEWKPDRYVLLDRFDQYKPQTGSRNGLGGGRIAYVDQVKFVPIGEESARIMALLNKEIDLDRYYPVKLVEKYYSDYKKKGIVLDEVTGLSWYCMHFGLDKPIVDNLKFRMACAYAIDIELVTQAAYFGHAKANPSAVSPQNQYWTPYHKTWYSKDVEKAKQLLKECGYQGEELVLDTTKKYIAMYRQAVAAQSELKAAGINVKLNVLEWPVMLKKYLNKDFQLMSFGYGAMPDPAQAYPYLKNNHFFEKYPDMLQVLERANATTDVKVRRELFEECHRITYETIPWIMFYNYNYLQAYQDYVKNYEVLPTGVPRAWGVWLDK